METEVKLTSRALPRARGANYKRKLSKKIWEMNLKARNM
jgi:hypothetical protein